MQISESVCQTKLIKYLGSSKYCHQRAGIADGGELEFRPPGTTAD